jgi:hypothetical protein
MSRAKVPIMASAAEAMSAAACAVFMTSSSTETRTPKPLEACRPWPSALSTRLLMTPQRSPHGT